MSKSAFVHIVDNDTNRRAQIARTLYGHGIHAEIYESLEELSGQPLKDGALLLSDELGGSAIEDALSSIHACCGYVPFAIFSCNPAPQKIVKALSAGALDYLKWPWAPDELVESVHRVCDLGHLKARSEERKADARRSVAALSPRGLDVLRLVVQGFSNKAAAQALGISPRTIEIHRANMMEALNAESVADAVRIGIYAGLDFEPLPEPARASPST